MKEFRRFPMVYVYVRMDHEGNRSEIETEINVYATSRQEAEFVAWFHQEKMPRDYDFRDN